MAYEHISAHTLYHMKDWDDFGIIHKAIVKAARDGKTELQFEWKSYNDKTYLIKEIKKHFTGIEVHSGEKTFTVSWANCCPEAEDLS